MAKKLGEKSPWQAAGEPLNSRLPGVPAFRHARVRSQKTPRRPTSFLDIHLDCSKGKNKGYSLDFDRAQRRRRFVRRFRPVRDCRRPRPDCNSGQRLNRQSLHRRVKTGFNRKTPQAAASRIRFEPRTARSSCRGRAGLKMSSCPISLRFRAGGARVGRSVQPGGLPSCADHQPKRAGSSGTSGKETGDR